MKTIGVLVLLVAVGGFGAEGNKLFEGARK